MASRRLRYLTASTLPHNASDDNQSELGQCRHSSLALAWPQFIVAWSSPQYLDQPAAGTTHYQRES